MTCQHEVVGENLQASSLTMNKVEARALSTQSAKQSESRRFWRRAREKKNWLRKIGLG